MEKKYHLVTWQRGFGDDDKDDCNTMQEVETLARKYIAEKCVVRVFRKGKLVKVYDDCFRRGRKPSAWELEKYQSK